MFWGEGSMKSWQEGRPWAKKRALGKWHQDPRWGRFCEWAIERPVLGIGQGWGLGAPLLVHRAQELLHI